MKKTKTSLIILLSLVIHSHVSAQTPEKLYFDADWKECSAENASYYRLINALENGLFDIKDYYMSGILQYETTASNKAEPFHKEGYTGYYTETGDTQNFAYYKNNKLHGTLVRFYSNGKRQSLMTLENGEQEGLMIKYFPWGGIKQSFSLHSGQIHGEAREYSIQGHLKNRSSYNRGQQQNGYELYYDNGQLAEKNHLNRKRTEGNYEKYHKNGQLKMKITIADNKVNDWVHRYDTAGIKVMSARFENQKVMEFIQFKRSLGSTFKKVMKREGDTEYWKVYRDEKLVLEGTYTDAERSAYQQKWVMFTADGKDTLMVMNFNSEDCLPDFGDVYSPLRELASLENLFVGGWIFSISSGDCKPQTRYVFSQNEEVIDMNHPFELAYIAADVEIDSEADDGAPATDRNARNNSGFDYTDPCTREPFMKKNNVQTKTIEGEEFLFCERQFGKITVYFYASEDVDALQYLESNVQPEDNEVYYFYQQFENKRYPTGYRPPQRYMRFGVSESMIEALSIDAVKSYELLDLIENKIFFTSDFTGGSAMVDLDKRIKAVRERAR